MQMDGRLDTLLSVLSEEEYVNLDTAAKKLQISQRTARTLVSQLGELLERHGAASNAAEAMAFGSWSETGDRIRNL